jgi:hypothetical protein
VSLDKSVNGYVLLGVFVLFLASLVLLCWYVDSREYEVVLVNPVIDHTSTCLSMASENCVGSDYNTCKKDYFCDCMLGRHTKESLEICGVI